MIIKKNKSGTRKSIKNKGLKLLIVIIAIAPMLFLTNCNKGKVIIYGIADTVQNCSLPYIVEFYPDAEFGSGDLRFDWDFGDGNSSTEESPVHIYTKTGLYQVTLTITNKEAQESKSITLDLQNESLPIIADWDYSTYNEQLWAPAKVFFQNFSQHTTSYIWDFGDGFTSQNENTDHVFVEPGAYNVKMGAICNGDTVISEKTLNVLPPPKDIYIDEVYVWLPSDYLYSSIYCEVYYNSYSEAESLSAVNISSFPVALPIRKELFFFHGDYGDDILAFEIWEASNTYDPAYVVTLPLYRIQDTFYPNVWTWDNGNGYAMEVYVQYRQ